MQLKDEPRLRIHRRIRDRSFSSNADINRGSPEGNDEIYLTTCFDPAAQRIPTLSEWGLISMAGILGIVGFMVVRRRKVTA